MFYVFSFVSLAVLVGIDQLTKYLTIAHLQNALPTTLIPGFLELTYVKNEGAAFGIMQGSRWFFVVLTGAFMLVLLGVLLFGRYRRYRLFNIGTILVVAGGIGNLIDRIFRGYVVDMIHAYMDNSVMTWDFPVFNVADCCVVIGSFLLLFFFFFVYDGKDGQTKEVYK